MKLRIKDIKFYIKRKYADIRNLDMGGGIKSYFGIKIIL